MRLLDLSGKKFNNLTVKYKASSARNGSVRWVCECVCGNITTMSSDHLTRKTQPVKSCGCLKKQIKGKNHHQWTGVGEISGNWWYNHVKREIKQNNRHRLNVKVTIQEAWDLFLKQDRKCLLSGLPIKFGNTSTDNTASLDRIDSLKGYELDNIQWVHKDINFMKRIYSQEYFIKMCKLVAENNK